MELILYDYGTGNLHSLRKALERQGAAVRVATDPTGADGLVLPGVGAFGAAAARLAEHREEIRAAVADGLPVLGICLGLQLLLDASEEGPGRGLGLIPGRVRRLRSRRVPHMGWNAVDAADPPDPLLEGVDGERFYFANSYIAEPDDPGAVIAWTDHDGDRFAAAVRHGRVVGTQFHPEKSDRSGLRLLGTWVDELRQGPGP